VLTTDKYVPLYVYEKQTNPSRSLVWRAYSKNVVDDVDRILDIAHGVREEVKTLNDWDIVIELLKFFARRWPGEFSEFKGQIDLIRKTRKSGAKSQSKEIMYVGALPFRFERLIKTIFPCQQFNKEFVYKLVKKISLFKVYKEGN
jgi:hypothetical protein